MRYSPHYFLWGLYKKVFYFNEVSKWQGASSSVAEKSGVGKAGKWLISGILIVPCILLLLTYIAKWSVGTVSGNADAMEGQLVLWLNLGVGVGLLFFIYFGMKFISFYKEMCLVGQYFEIPVISAQPK